MVAVAQLQTFFNFSELGGKHRIVGGEFSAVRRKLDLFIVRWTNGAANSREQALTELQEIVEELSKLGREGTPLPPGSWDAAKKQIEKLRNENVFTSAATITANMDKLG